MSTMGMPGIFELVIVGVLGLACVGIPVILLVMLVSNRRQHQVQVTECHECGKVSPTSDFCPHCGAKSIKGG